MVQQPDAGGTACCQHGSAGVCGKHAARNKRRRGRIKNSRNPKVHGSGCFDFVLFCNIRRGTVYRLKDCSGFTDIRTGRQPKPALPYSGRAAADQPPVLLTARWIPKQFALRTRPEVCRQRLCQWKRFVSRTLPRHERGFLPVWAVRFSKQSFTGIFFVCPYCHFAGRGV